jgi:hypothetical protein
MNNPAQEIVPAARQVRLATRKVIEEWPIVMESRIAKDTLQQPAPVVLTNPLNRIKSNVRLVPAGKKC